MSFTYPRWRFWALLALLLTAGLPESQAQALSDTIQTASGMRYSIRELGKGATAQAGDKLVINYTGFLPNGRLFDSSAADGRPLRCRVGRGEVIKGWDEVLLLLPAGSRARVWIPAALAYGSKGVRDPDEDTRFLIPPGSDLVFEMEIIKVNK